MRKFIFALVVATLFALPATLQATFIEIDQQQEFYDAGIRVFSARSLSQTFTAGQSGDLAGIAIRLTGNYPLDGSLPSVISILGTTAGVPNDADVLWTVELPSLGQGWFSVDTSVGAPTLISGVSYAIVFACADSVVGTPDNLWDVQRTGNPYPGGQLFEKRTGGWVPLTISGTSYPNADATFRTYMLIPEPATFCLFVLGSFPLLRRRTR